MTVARRRSTARSTSSRFLALLIHAGSRATRVIFRPVSYQGARSRRSAATNRLMRSRCWRLYAHSSPCRVPVRSHRSGQEQALEYREEWPAPAPIRHRPQDRQTRRVCGRTHAVGVPRCARAPLEVGDPCAARAPDQHRRREVGERGARVVEAHGCRGHAVSVSAAPVAAHPVFRRWSSPPTPPGAAGVRSSGPPPGGAWRWCRPRRAGRRSRGGRCPAGPGPPASFPRPCR